MPGFYGSRIIAAVRDEQGIESACGGMTPAVFLLHSDALSAPAQVERLHHFGKKVFLHIDLTEGIASDSAGVRFIAKNIRPDGLISTKAHLLRFAKDEGMETIQRLFLVDSSSLETGRRLVSSSKPDYVEVLPGLVPKAITYLCRNLPMPVIAGGMITDAADMAQAIGAGAAAVSTSTPELWRLA